MASKSVSVLVYDPSNVQCPYETHPALGIDLRPILVQSAKQYDPKFGEKIETGIVRALALCCEKEACVSKFFNELVSNTLQFIQGGAPKLQWTDWGVEVLLQIDFPEEAARKKAIEVFIQKFPLCDLVKQAPASSDGKEGKKN